MEDLAIQAIVVVIALGALLSAWAVAHFNNSLPQKEIRFSVPQGRYLVAVVTHVCFFLAIYVILIVLTYLSIRYLSPNGIPPRSCFQLTYSEHCKNFLISLETDPGTLVWSALASVLLVRFVIPNIPTIWRLFDRLRDITRGIALFPDARQSLMSVLSVSPFAAQSGSESELRQELARYGVSANLLSFLSHSTTGSLLEVLSLRRRLIEISDWSCALAKRSWRNMILDKKSVLVFDGYPAGANKFALWQFWRARAATFAQLDTDFRRLIRRTALSLRFVEEIGENVTDEVLRRTVSNFVAGECDDVLSRHRRLTADVALSCVRRSERVKFLKLFGYEVSLPSPFPLRPWVIVFSLDLLLFLIPVVAMRFTENSVDFPNTAAHSPLLRWAFFACVHAISQSVAITWAILPKTANFARPTPYSLPLQSYIVFGLASYVTGAIILFMFRLTLPIPFPILLPTLLNSMSFLLMTVGMSLLIDLRLQSGSFDFEQRRVRDGMVICLLMLASTVTFQVVMFGVGPRLHLVDTSAVPVPPALIRALFLTLSASLGFLMGYFVPAAAAAYLLAPRQLDRGRGDSRRPPTFAARLSTAA